jgi:hypothetical protein
MPTDFLNRCIEEGCLRVHNGLAIELKYRLGIEPIPIDERSCLLLPEDIRIWDSALKNGSYEAVALVA